MTVSPFKRHTSRVENKYSATVSWEVQDLRALTDKYLTKDVGKFSVVLIEL